MLLCTVVMYSQKKKNGTIYKEHPAIKVVEDMQKAFVKGDSAAVASYLADDFKGWNGFNDNPDAKPMTKANFAGNAIGWNKYVDYFNISRFPGAYPDALEYDKEGTWVQTWDILSGMEKRTGMDMTMPIHRLYVVNKDNKIASMINYFDESKFMGMREAMDVRPNGTIYDQHTNINTVRKMLGALAHGDVDKGFSYFTDDARFSNLDMPMGETHTVAEEKEGFKNMLKNWDIVSMDVVGYPDYLEYDRGNSKVVQSWWNFKAKRKSDGKTVTIPIHFVHDFNDDGKITREAGYYTTAAMAD